VETSNAKARSEAAQFLQLIEALQPKLLAANEKIQSQQDSLN
jgi:hypothetical protein